MCWCFGKPSKGGRGYLEQGKLCGFVSSGFAVAPPLHFSGWPNHGADAKLQEWQ